MGLWQGAAECQWPVRNININIMLAAGPMARLYGIVFTRTAVHCKACDAGYASIAHELNNQ